MPTPKQCRQEEIRIRSIATTIGHLRRIPKHSNQVSNLHRSLGRSYHKSRKRYIRYGLLIANIGLLVGVAGFLLRNQESSRAVRQSTAINALGGSGAVGPLDTVSSADIAVHVAELTGLDDEEVIGVRNTADSYNLQLTSVPVDDAIVAKPQIVDTALKSKKDIITYTVIAGDNIPSIASKFGVTSDTIRWSNDVTGDSVAAGKQLLISPINGIVYIVKAGDTVDSLASKYRANKDQLIAINDAEISGLIVGDRIIIPDGVVVPVRTATARSTPVYVNFVPRFGGNGYIRGYCTWYVASRIAVPTNWGNANTWDNFARQSGWTVSSVPKVGAIAQTDRMSSLGHVAVVDEVSADGTMIIYSDMNGIAGYNRVGRSGWVPASTYPNYIY